MLLNRHFNLLVEAMFSATQKKIDDMLKLIYISIFLLKLCSLLHKLYEVGDGNDKIYISIFLLKLCSLLHLNDINRSLKNFIISIFLLKLCSLLHETVGNYTSDPTSYFNLLVEAMFSATISAEGWAAVCFFLFQSSCWSYVLCYCWCSKTIDWI